jgi:hypothetical protein
MSGMSRMMGENWKSKYRGENEEGLGFSWVTQERAGSN